MTRQRLTDPVVVGGIIAMALLVFYSITFVITYYVVNGPDQDRITVCHTQDMFHSNWWLGLLIIILMAGVFALGLLADYKMMDLIDERNEDPAQGLQAKDDAHIPVVVSQQQITHEIPKNSSTVIGIYSGFGLIVSIIVYNPCSFNEPIWLFNVLCLASGLVFYPCFFFFAFKKREDKSQQKPNACLNFLETESQQEASMAFQQEMELYEAQGSHVNGKEKLCHACGQTLDKKQSTDKATNQRDTNGDQDDENVSSNPLDEVKFEASNLGHEGPSVLPGQVE